MTRQNTRWRRRIFGTVTAVVWVIFVLLLMHESSSPVHFGRYSAEYFAFLGFVLAAVLGVSGIAYLAVARPAIMRSLGVVKSLSLLVVSLLVTLAVGELLTRYFDPLGVSMFEEVTRYMKDLEPDDVLNYRHKANLDAVYQGVRIRTNEIGLRDRPLLSGASNEVRVLFVGDSVTLGWGVEQNDTFAARLEPMLTKAFGCTVRTINSGVAGYDSVQELAFVESHIESLAPDLVVLVYVENDIERNEMDVMDVREKWEHPQGVRENLVRWSWLYRIAEFVKEIVGRPAEVGDAQKADVADSMQAVARMSDVASAADAEFVTFFYRMLPDPKTDELLAAVQQVADRKGFPTFDMLPWFEGAHITTLINSFIDSHPNADGHAIIAKGIASKLSGYSNPCGP